MTSTPINKKKSNKNSKEVIERYPPPDIESLILDDNIIFKSALNNDYQTICGAYDAKEHPLVTFINEHKLFDKKNEYGKNAFDLAALIGNKEFIRTILLRTDEKIDENVFSLKNLLKPSNSYNFMHYACIWGRLELVKFLVEHQKLMLDPVIENSDLLSNSNMTIQTSKSSSANSNMKTLGSILLRSKTKTGETPRDLAKRYNHEDLLEYLNYAEKRQSFLDNISEIKFIASDPEKNQNKLTKDDKKKLEKLYVDTLDWLDKNKDSTDMELLDSQIKFTENEVKPILDKISNQDSNVSNSNLTAGSISQRSNKTSKV
ncbi:unnamed protein product [Brachionus calyciflorus]|uniref:Uncharacterized protein n=1 Tax=Brachionus calyciflorus TaxID=104777 RepID=A0A813WX32_9BILA|nr:unnamed protein product [Brachionus calyciflorus]